MRPLLFIVLLMIAPSFTRAEDTLQQQYLAVYLKINEAEHQEQRMEYAGAAASFRDIYASLMKIHDADPRWESALVQHRLADCQTKIRELDGKVAAATDVDAPNQTALVHQMVADSKNDPTLGTHKSGPTVSYPWKEGILTTFFYIGEDSSHSSAWNEEWTKSNHGADDPDNRNGYATALHASSVNPFYVALPFNDLAHPDQAKEYVPRTWAPRLVNGKPLSACKDRWVEIKSASGRTCYAQWEDVGPNGNGDAAYVFGSDRPATDKAGLDVSPAVAQYLSLDTDKKAVTSWRFVDDQDVPPGQWLKYDEQAVIYTALHQEQKAGN